MVSPHLSIYRYCLTLNTGDGAQHKDGTIQYSKGPLNLDSEVDVSYIIFSLTNNRSK